MKVDSCRMIIDGLRAHPDDVQAVVEGLTETQLKRRPSGWEWSIYELALHVCDVQDAYIEQLSRMLTEDKPRLASSTPDDDRQRGGYPFQGFKKRLAEYKHQRTTMASLLETLTDEQWAFEGIHPGIEHYTIRKSMENLMRHEDHYLNQMRELFLQISGRG